MANDLNKFISGIRILAQEAQDFLNRDEVKIFAKKVASGIQRFGEFAQNFYTYSQDQKKMYIEMSKFGWFPSYITFKTPVLEGETADDYMERCLTDNHDDIKTIILESYPNRKHILDEAFNLFEEGRYIAAIPLFISQLDGLSAEYGLSPYFTNTKLSRSERKKLSGDQLLKFEKFPIYLKKSLENKLLGQSQEIVSYYEEVIENACDSFILKNTNSVDTDNPINILNRHGILHGHENFLNYGDKRNCLKIISLFLFVDHILSLLDENLDQVDKTEGHP
ncbi:MULTISPECIES: hypothetical protein [Acinetobacter]|uniref:hypothetical protein n=1 Tax=Acinetobacter TaxID=469 RepID=UPI0006685D7F|nr:MULTISPECIES: hypothetical protein [Acinetobacter]